MKIMIIPDIHGRSIWKYDVKEQEVDKYIFLGDYTDSFILSNIAILHNLKEIIQFKNDNLDKVELLLGNHDLQYMYNDLSRFGCSGYRPEALYDLHDLFRNNKHLFKNCYQIDNWIFSHAGIQHNWFLERFKGNLNESIADQINNPKNRNQEDALYQVGSMRGGMRYDVGGPFWCDRQELKKPLENFNQVVGHTPVKKNIEYKYKNSIVYFTDCQDSDEYEPLIIKINE